MAQRWLPAFHDIVANTEELDDRLPRRKLRQLEGATLARSTICSWHQQLADLVEPLVEARSSSKGQEE